ncbi:hypothetical protein FA15DRAFT_638213 [Coprinopsis marcescibilis]|uniref:BHLH domain-containing protein n=1 Tax=Coprinopsis marcescibilis TaxID=230819 RepID=A0A5C3L095_COPMA|nr:hypothetical protein FA15DRAFT_638213 [Coprinopsis marcescibilis]
MFPLRDNQGGNGTSEGSGLHGEARGNQRPDMGASIGTHGSHRGSTMSMARSSSRGSINVNTATSPANNVGPNRALFIPSSPMQPSSPNSQLTMQLLGNLMQMQGLDGGGFSLPSSAIPVGTTSSGGSDNMNFGLGGMSFGQQQSNNSQDILSSPFLGNAMHSQSGGAVSLPSAAVLEQQIKLQQLQQLQQLQNQIFQQQMAIISQSPVLNKSTNVDVDHHYHQHASTSQAQNSFSGLPTPGPSTELRPTQPHPMEFVSPMQLNYNMDPDNSNSQDHSHSQSHTPPDNYTPHEDTFSQPLPSPLVSQSNLGYHQSHMHSTMHRGVSSAPEHLAFDIRSGPSGRDFDIDISPLTSPWLGAYGGAGPSHSVSNGSTNLRNSHPGLRNVRNVHSVDGDRLSRKRTASPDETSLHARKKHSPAIGPTPANVGSSMLPPQSPNPSGPSISRKPSISNRGSKSTSSTPLLRGTRNRSKSSVAAPIQMTPIHAPNLEEGSNASGNPLSSDSSLPAAPDDSPSPVDLSVPPSGPSATAIEHANAAMSDSGGSIDGFAAGTTRLYPVTPASIMNLGRLGMSTNPAEPTTKPSMTSVTTRGKGKAKESNGKGSKVNAAPSLKAILPAGDPNNATNSMEGSPDVGTGQKKSSHKAAEQKRRDSLKTTFDDLRKLLPPIAFEDTIEEEGGKDKVLPVRGPLLPGALPPRGPPKVGGDGPNKGISKLQLLICGNQYIRTLKGRLDRRDQEIEKLRNEVRRLRNKVGVLNGEGWDTGMDVDSEKLDDGLEDELDLEKDLDAIEGMTVRIGRVQRGVDDDDDDE